MSQSIVLVDAMGRPLNASPTYVYHPRGIGRIYWRGTFMNLPGDFNSPESLAAYHRLCQIVAATGQLPDKSLHNLTVAELGSRFESHAKSHYTGSQEATNLSYAVRALVDLFGDTPAESFGPSSLKAVRAMLIGKGQCRNTVNARAKQIVAIFRWAVEEELVDQSVWTALKAVRAISRGRDGAFDYEPVRPVRIEHFLAAVEWISERYRPAIEVQRWTGMRSGELLAMRPQDVDMTGRHWFYRPYRHKTAGVIGEKIVGIPAPAADVLRSCLPKTWSHVWFPWRVDTHCKAVQRACDRAGVPRWHPHQLRHGVATLCDQLFGESGKEAARLILAHTDVRTTGRYVMPTIETLTPILDRMSEPKGNPDDCDLDHRTDLSDTVG